MQREALEDALRQLYVMDALDRDGRITKLGEQMVRLPLEPTLARVLLAAAQLDCLPSALSVAALLSAESLLLAGRCPSPCFPCSHHPGSSPVSKLFMLSLQDPSCARPTAEVAETRLPADEKRWPILRYPALDENRPFAPPAQIAVVPYKASEWLS